MPVHHARCICEGGAADFRSGRHEVINALAGWEITTYCAERYHHSAESYPACDAFDLEHVDLLFLAIPSLQRAVVTTCDAAVGPGHRTV